MASFIQAVRRDILIILGMPTLHWLFDELYKAKYQSFQVQGCKCTLLRVRGPFQSAFERRCARFSVLDMH